MIEIRTTIDLYNIKNNPSGHYVQVANIDLGGIGSWSPIFPDIYETFTGTYDGNGYVIKNLYQDAEAIGNSYLGLFGAVDGATFLNVDLQDVYIKAESRPNERIGALFSIGTLNIYYLDEPEHYVNIKNCVVTGEIYAPQSFVGGICGSVAGLVIEEAFAKMILAGQKVGSLVYEASICIAKNCGSISTIDAEEAAGFILYIGDAPPKYGGPWIYPPSLENVFMATYINADIAYPICEAYPVAYIEDGQTKHQELFLNRVLYESYFVPNQANYIGTDSWWMTETIINTPEWEYGIVWTQGGEDEDHYPVLISFLKLRHGSGTEFDPYLIYNDLDLGLVPQYKNAYFKQVNNIPYFNRSLHIDQGLHYDGNGKSIYGIGKTILKGHYNQHTHFRLDPIDGELSLGLFGIIEDYDPNDYSEIKNLTLHLIDVGYLTSEEWDNPQEISSIYAGVLVGSYYHRNPSALNPGLTLSNVHVAGNIVVDFDDYTILGGAVGLANRLYVKDCSSQIEIETSSHQSVTGGLLGSTSSCLIEKTKVSLNQNYSPTMITGGIVGGADFAEIRESACQGLVDIEMSYNFSGGLIGLGLNVIISDSYSLLKIRTDGVACGGLLAAANESVLIMNSYFAGNIFHTPDETIASRPLKSTMGKEIGPIVGIIYEEEDFDLISTYYREHSVISSNPLNINNIGQELSLFEMYRKSSYKDWNWENIWTITENKNNDLPYQKNTTDVLPFLNSSIYNIALDDDYLYNIAVDDKYLWSIPVNSSRPFDVWRIEKRPANNPHKIEYASEFFLRGLKTPESDLTKIISDDKYLYIASQENRTTAIRRGSSYNNTYYKIDKRDLAIVKISETFMSETGHPYQLTFRRIGDSDISNDIIFHSGSWHHEAEGSGSLPINTFLALMDKYNMKNIIATDVAEGVNRNMIHLSAQDNVMSMSIQPGYYDDDPIVLERNLSTLKSKDVSLDVDNATLISILSTPDDLFTLKGHEQYTNYLDPIRIKRRKLLSTQEDGLAIFEHPEYPDDLEGDYWDAINFSYSGKKKGTYRSTEYLFWVSKKILYRYNSSEGKAQDSLDLSDWLSGDIVAMCSNGVFVFVIETDWTLHLINARTLSVISSYPIIDYSYQNYSILEMHFLWGYLFVIAENGNDWLLRSYDFYGYFTKTITSQEKGVGELISYSFFGGSFSAITDDNQLVFCNPPYMYFNSDYMENHFYSALLNNDEYIDIVTSPILLLQTQVNNIILTSKNRALAISEASTVYQEQRIINNPLDLSDYDPRTLHSFVDSTNRDAYITIDNKNYFYKFFIHDTNISLAQIIQTSAPERILCENVGFLFTTSGTNIKQYYKKDMSVSKTISSQSDSVVAAEVIEVPSERAYSDLIDDIYFGER